MCPNVLCVCKSGFAKFTHTTRHSAQFASIQEPGNGREWVCNLAVGRSAAFVGVFCQGRGVKKSAAEEAAADMALLAIEVRMWERACMIFIST